jgi:hypothetical protein
VYSDFNQFLADLFVNSVLICFIFLSLFGISNNILYMYKIHWYDVLLCQVNQMFTSGALIRVTFYYRVAFYFGGGFTCENSFCGGCIRTWINKQTHEQVTCPFNCVFQEKRAPPILNTFLSKLKIYCAYAPNGCREVLSYDALERHEQTCQCENTPCQICQKSVSRRDKNNKHELRQCFKEMYDRNPDHIQTQFIKLLDVVEASQRRIQALENLLGIDPQQNQ